MKALSEKAVGDDVQNQAGWPILHLKRLFPKSSHLRVVIDDFGSLQNYSSLNEYQRQTHEKRVYDVFDTIVAKISASKGMKDQRVFLNSRFHKSHSNKPQYTPLINQASKKSVKMMDNLITRNTDNKYAELNERQK